MVGGRRLAILFACLALGPGSARGQQSPAPPADEEAVQDAQEPGSRLRAFAFQNNFDFGTGPADRTGYRFFFQPWQAEVGRGRWLRVKSFSAVPMLYRPDPLRPEGGTFGLGDPEISMFWSPAKTGTAVLWVAAPAGSSGWGGGGWTSSSRPSTTWSTPRRGRTRTGRYGSSCSSCSRVDRPK